MPKRVSFLVFNCLYTESWKAASSIFDIGMPNVHEPVGGVPDGGVPDGCVPFLIIPSGEGPEGGVPFPIIPPLVLFVIMPDGGVPFGAADRLNAGRSLVPADWSGVVMDEAELPADCWDTLSDACVHPARTTPARRSADAISKKILFFSIDYITRIALQIQVNRPV